MSVIALAGARPFHAGGLALALQFQNWCRCSQKLLSKVSSGLVLTLQFLSVLSFQKLLMNASSGLVLTLLFLGVSCHSLGLSSR